MMVETMLRHLRDGRDPLNLAMDLLYSALDQGDLTKSVRQCHTPGLDSVVLFSGEGMGMVRFYIAHGGKNEMHRLYDDDGHFLVGVHNHRYEIAKIPLNNAITNVRTSVASDPFEEPDRFDPERFTSSVCLACVCDPMHVTTHSDYGQPWIPSVEEWEDQRKYYLYEYGFNSALKGGGMEVKSHGLRHMESLDPQLLVPGSVAVMAPEDLHTVLVPKDHTTAWMVIEGPPVDIDPLIYSPRSDLKLSPEGLYEPMPEQEARALIWQAIRLVGR